MFGVNLHVTIYILEFGAYFTCCIMSFVCFSILLLFLLFFFFFQAEDGIRDLIVTGVQTCALPIYSVITQAVPLTPIHPSCNTCVNGTACVITESGVTHVDCCTGTSNTCTKCLYCRDRKSVV